MIRSCLVMAASIAAAAPAVAGDCSAGCLVGVRAAPREEVVAERVIARAPRTYAILTPARYETVTETVVVEPARRRWARSLDAGGRTVGRWVDMPARTATVTRRVMVSAPDLVPYAVPALHDVRMTAYPVGGLFDD